MIVNPILVVELDSVTNDQFEVIIQDDLTGLISFTAYVSGHVVID